MGRAGYLSLMKCNDGFCSNQAGALWTCPKWTPFGQCLHEANVDRVARGLPVHTPGTLFLPISANESAAALDATASA